MDRGKLLCKAPMKQMVIDVNYNVFGYCFCQNKVAYFYLYSTFPIEQLNFGTA